MGLGEKIDLEKEIVELEQFKKEVLKPYYDKREALLQRYVEEYGDGHYFQDEETGVVYTVGECKGQYVFNKPLEIQRTRTADETKGTISEKFVKTELGLKFVIAEKL